MLELLMVMIGAGATMMAGIPVAVRLARAGFADVDLSGSANKFGSARTGGDSAGFAPLDLGPDPMQWPSAKPWKRSNLPIPQWPSTTWDDEHFGRHGKPDGYDQSTHEERQRARPAPEPERQPRKQRPTVEQRQAQEAQRHADQEEQRRQAARAELEKRQRSRAQQQEQQQQQAQQRKAQQRQAQQQRQVQQQRQAQKARKPQPQGGPDGAPAREELLRLVDTVGLAGTVQEIMKRTGWDFRKAAQYLARVRSGG